MFLIAIIGLIGANTFGFWGFGGISWEEEVLLHDGSNIIIKRSVERGGRHEIGQRPPIKKQSLSFTLPSSQQTVNWKVEYARDIGYADLSPIMLDIVDNIPFLVTRTVGCLAYNKWGRPNPPYIIFRYINKTWQQIELKNLPLALKVPNMIISSPDVMAQRTEMKVVPASKINEINSSLSQPEYKSILREPVKIWCKEHIHTGTYKWLSIDWFSEASNYNACIDVCAREKVSRAECPCQRFFKKGE